MFTGSKWGIRGKKAGVHVIFIWGPGIELGIVFLGDLSYNGFSRDPVFVTLIIPSSMAAWAAPKKSLFFKQSFSFVSERFMQKQTIFSDTSPMRSLPWLKLQ